MLTPRSVLPLTLLRGLRRTTVFHTDRSLVSAPERVFWNNALFEPDFMDGVVSQAKQTRQQKMRPWAHCADGR
jgi:hypothetical protein